MYRRKLEKGSFMEDESPVNIDPKCFQEALRMFFIPIKNDDPKIDFYTMYKRETTEYDTEYMQKYNEDLNTTLIFAGLFSAVSSAFILDVQSKLEPDSGERSEAYLRAILLTLNQSIIPDELPVAPPAWNGPPAEVVTTVILLYASLLISLLAAFVGMLGKQWVNRYLRHTGGSTLERCGDRQRKFDGLEKWPFHSFIESLPIMLQVALLLLASGLSRYVWSLHVTVARVIVSFTAIGFIFYIGIVVAGTSSYECPFQTPASIALRHLRDSKTVRKWLSSLFPTSAIPPICTARRNTQQGFISTLCHVYDIIRSPLSWEASLSDIPSGIHSMARKVGHQAIILFLQLDRAFGNAKHGLVQEIRRFIQFSRATLLPFTATDSNSQLSTPHDGPRFRVRVRNLGAIRKQNRDDARCVYWIIQNMTDPEAVDSAIRLAGTIQWFDGDSNYDPQFDFITEAFEACFDLANQLYPGMKDRAYSSAQAILRINASARTQPQDCAVKYCIPSAISSSSYPHADPDLYHVISMLKSNSNGPTLEFPRGRADNHPHLLWMSNLFMEITRVGPNPVLKSYRFYLSAAITNNRPIIANILLVWYMLLGGQVEEGTFWVGDRSDSLNTILDDLSKRVMVVIAGETRFQPLDYLIVFLVAWKERPSEVTRMFSEWYSAIDKAAGRLGPSQRSNLPRQFQLQLQLQLQLQAQPEPQAQDTAVDIWEYLSPISEKGFSEVGLDCNPLRNTLYPPHGSPQGLIPGIRVDILLETLKVGFGLPTSITDQREWMFGIAFSSDDDEVIADAVSAWIVGDGHISSGLCVHRLSERIGRNTPFSPRLRKQSIHAIERIWNKELEGSEPETVHLLNDLRVRVGDMENKGEWVQLLKSVMRFTGGKGDLSSHYWDLLDEVTLTGGLSKSFKSGDADLMESLKGEQEWKKLEVWTALVWQTLPDPSESYRSGFNWDSYSNRIEATTLELLSKQPSAFSKLDNLRKTRSVDSWTYESILQGVLARSRNSQGP